MHDIPCQGDALHGTVSHADNDREDTHGGSRWSLSGFTRNVGCEGLIYAYDGGNSDSRREIDVRQKNSLHQPIIIDNLASSPRHISLLYHTSSPNTTYRARQVVRHTLYTTMITLTSDQLSTIVSPHFDLIFLASWSVWTLPYAVTHHCHHCRVRLIVLLLSQGVIRSHPSDAVVAVAPRVWR
jgi:hypothetical protein